MKKRLDDKQLAALAAKVRAGHERQAALDAELNKLKPELASDVLALEAALYPGR